MKRSLTCVGFALMALALMAAPSFAGDCDFGPSAGAAPASAAGCGAGASMGGGGVPGFDPTDMAMSPDGVLATCALMTLNAPEVVTASGPFVDFRPACDFAGDDFTTLYCTDSGAPATLFALDTASCTESVVGTANNTGSETPSGLAWDPTTDTMYMSTTDVVTSSLHTIDVGNGSSALVGNMTDSPANISIGVDNSGQIFGHDIVTDGLHAISKVDGSSVLVGATGFDGNFAQGMDFDAADGTCYIFGFNNTTFQAELFTCDTGSGAATLVGVIGSSSPGGLQEWTGPGIMASGGGQGCSLHASAGGTGLGSGEMIPISLHLTHVRAKAVTRSFKITLVNGLGMVVAKMRTPGVTMRPNETVHRNYGLRVPNGTPAGQYTVKISINGMQQGKVDAALPVTIN